MQYYAHNNITRKMLLAFMDFFTDISIERYNPDLTSRRLQTVPVSYIQTDKWLQIYNSSSARKQMDLDNNIAPVEMQWVIPRLSVNLINVLFDTDRHLNKLKQIKLANNDVVFAPVPYNLEIELSSITKNLDDSFQIMEQILPYFSPGMSIDVNVIEGNPESIPITLNTVSFNFPEEISELEERLYIVTYGFTMRGNYYFQKSTKTRIDHHIVNVNSNNTEPFDGTITLFSQYVQNALTPSNPNPLVINFTKDTDKVTLTRKGAWDGNNIYTNYDMVNYGNNNFIWIGGTSYPNIEPGHTNWEKVWTVNSALESVGITFKEVVEPTITTEFVV
jgi:hypothetical protein